MDVEIEDTVSHIIELEEDEKILVISGYSY